LSLQPLCSLAVQLAFQLNDPKGITSQHRQLLSLAA
jgi:hypothetical protein